jgi:hypothetical protein
MTGTIKAILTLLKIAPEKLESNARKTKTGFCLIISKMNLFGVIKVFYLGWIYRNGDFTISN